MSEWELRGGVQRVHAVPVCDRVYTRCGVRDQRVRGRDIARSGVQCELHEHSRCWVLWECEWGSDVQLWGVEWELWGVQPVSVCECVPNRARVQRERVRSGERRWDDVRRDVCEWALHGGEWERDVQPGSVGGELQRVQPVSVPWGVHGGTGVQCERVLGTDVTRRRVQRDVHVADVLWARERDADV